MVNYLSSLYLTVADRNREKFRSFCTPNQAMASRNASGRALSLCSFLILETVNVVINHSCKKATVVIANARLLVL